MKRTILILPVIITAVILIGCSRTNPLAPVSSIEPDYHQMYVRPEIIDDRPEDVKIAHTLTICDPVKLDENAPKGAKYALCIGISDYAGTANDLKYCDDDARDWAARLQREGYSVTTLLDRSATKAAIESAINTLASKAIAGNEIAFCYSGHGYKGNMISTDMYYINYSWMKTKFSSATSTKMAFAFDACQIGAFATALKANGRVIAVASNSTTYSYDGDASMSNGVFTYYQMVAFDQLGYVYYEPDCQYACEQMKAWAAARKLKVAPSYVDSYTGQLDL
jgi:uncharacterized caspase-like protein